MNEQKSQCCGAKRRVCGSDEGTYYYDCQNCGKEFIADDKSSRGIGAPAMDGSVVHIENPTFESTESWPKEFDRLFHFYGLDTNGDYKMQYMLDDGESYEPSKVLKSFISSLLSTAVQAERNRILKIVREYIDLHPMNSPLMEVKRCLTQE